MFSTAMKKTVRRGVSSCLSRMQDERGGERGRKDGREETMLSIGAANCNRNSSTSTHFILFSSCVARAARVFKSRLSLSRNYPSRFDTFKQLFSHVFISYTFLFSPIFSLSSNIERLSLSLSLSLSPPPSCRATSNETSGFRNFSKISEPLPCIREFKNAYPPSSVPVDTIIHVPPFRAPLHPLSSPSNISLSLSLSRCPLKRSTEEVDRGGKEETRSRQGKRTDKRWINSSNHANPSIPVINRAHENARKRDSRHPCPFVLS